jgi:hypothetical protein
MRGWKKKIKEWYLKWNYIKKRKKNQQTNEQTANVNLSHQSRLYYYYY